MWDKIVIGVGLLGAILIFVLFLSAEIPGAGAIVSGVLFSLWLLFAFNTNDESRRASEDIQQFHNSHPDTDLTDHYYWDDVLDAETDGYMDGE